MTETKHTINILTFSHPEEKKEFGFKLIKEEGYSPLHRSELSEPQKVVLQIYGHAIDENYSKLL